MIALLNHNTHMFIAFKSDKQFHENNSISYNRIYKECTTLDIINRCNCHIYVNHLNHFNK